MSTLAETLERMQRCVLADACDPAAVADLLRPDAGAGGAERGVAVYHSAYRARLREVLGGVFDRTWAYVGDDDFEALCAHHIASFPSRHPNLRDYGAALPVIASARLPDDPEAAELATMDWKLHLAFDAPDTAVVDPARLAALDEAAWSSARFVFAASVSTAVFAWNVRDIWHAIDQGRVPPPARRLPAPEAHLFWRQGHRACFRSMTPPEHAVMTMLLDGAGFAGTCAWLAEHDPDSAELPGVWLAQWLAEGLLSRIEI